jgi:hypothetical protein
MLGAVATVAVMKIVGSAGFGWGLPSALLALASCSPQPKSASSSSPPLAANAPGEDGSPDAPSGWRSPLAINLSKIADWSSETPFIDAFQESREWIPQLASSNVPWTTNSALDLDSYEQVKSLTYDQAAGTLLFNDLKGHYPAGTYTLLYEGEGGFAAYHDGKIESQWPGKVEIKVQSPSNGGIHLKLVATNPANPVRNMRLLMPGFTEPDQAERFHPDFMQQLRIFQAIRFMDWQSTNNSPLKHWSERTTLQHARQTGPKGAAVEWMVRLANISGCDPWFCIPHQATDDFVTQFATLVRDTMQPNLKAYVEYSNEVWNGQFSQCQYAQQQGLAQGLSNNAYEAGLRFYSKRSVEIFNIWHQVFGAQKDRVIRVLAGQAGNPWTGQVIMDHAGAYQHADAYAVAPYFGGSFGSPSMASTVANWSLDKLFDELRKDLKNTMNNNLVNATNAAQRGLALIAYEGGQHLAGHGGAENNEALTALFQQANRDERMGQLYTDYLGLWRHHGGRLFALFNNVEAFTKWGSWGLMEYMDSEADQSPKFESVRRFVKNNHQWW